MRRKWGVLLAVALVCLFAGSVKADTIIDDNSIDVSCTNPVGQGETFRIYANVQGYPAYPYNVTFGTPFGTYSVGLATSKCIQSVSRDIAVPSDFTPGSYGASGSTRLYRPAPLPPKEYSDSTSFRVMRKGIDINPIQTTVVAGETLYLSAVVHGLMNADGWDRRTLYVDGPWGTVELTNPQYSSSTYDNAYSFSGQVTVPYETLSGTYTVTFRASVFRYAQFDWPYQWDTLTATLPINVLKPPDVRDLTARVEDAFALSGLPLGISAQTPSLRAKVETLKVISSWGIEAPMQTSDGVYFRGQLPILKNTKTGPMEVKVLADISQPPHYPAKRIEKTLDVFVKSTAAREQPFASGNQTVELPDWWTPLWYQW